MVLMSDLIAVMIMAIIALPLKFYIDKCRYLKKLHEIKGIESEQVYKDCKSQIKEVEIAVNQFAKSKKIHIIWVPSFKKLNASAGMPFLIVLTGDWSFLADKSKSALAYLYSTIGHELSHKDKEPCYSCSKFSHNLKNHVRETRADFCGVAFAMNFFEDRDFIIQNKFAYGLSNDNKDKKTDHPSNALRKACLEKHKRFSIDVIKDIIEAKEYCDIGDKTISAEYINILEQKCYRGKIFRKGTF